MGADIKVITYEIPPSYIDSIGGIRQFQLEMVRFAENSEKRVAVLSAPTGAGKTLGFSMMGNGSKTTLIVFPNNLLSNETLHTFNKTGVNDVALLNASSINRVMREKKSMGFHDFTLRKAIGLILRNKKFILTNPTVFYNLLTNHYSQQSREDMLSELMRNNLSTVIFDEFHIYSRDQTSMILASTLLLRNDVKLMFASATLPNYLNQLLIEMYGEDQVCKITVERTQQRSEGSEVLQGKLNIHIYKGTAIDFIRSNPKIFESGKWFLILDSIRNIHEANQEFVPRIAQSNIMLISAYHDPSYETYAMVKNGMIGKRIIIGSNVVEQGINPPCEYTNFLIEPGYSLESFIQRAGRIGRGSSVVSELYIAIKTNVSNFPEKVEKIDDLFDFISDFGFGYERPPWMKSLGTYLWFIIDKLTANAKEAVLENLKKGSVNSSLLAACFSTKHLDMILGDKQFALGSSRILVEIKEISEWWKNYKETIYKFIPSQNEIQVLDTSEDFMETGGFMTEYSELWLRKNKEIVDEKDGMIIVKDFRDRPDFNFSVYVTGLPFASRVKMRYGDIYFKSRKEIIDRFKIFYKQYFGLPDEIKDVLEALGNCILSTAGPERLVLCTK
ncbi:CRISPR-associated helicase Cas3, subtype CYANO [Thermoplasmatales archaeon]|nr:CRISPR-associated helicase Cas3, subtype CYANO [Thermoplasmatales archaeon]